MTSAQRAGQATAEVLAALGHGHHCGAVVDCPPGAGKSTLVARAAADLATDGETVMVVAQTNGQVDDLATRIAVARPQIAIGRLSGQDYQPTARIARHRTVTASRQLNDVARCPIIIATAAKGATVTGEASWPWAVVDEAYQMRSDMLLRIAGRFDRALFVGDPGQLNNNGSWNSPPQRSARARWTGRSGWPPPPGWALYELPARHTLPTDAEAVQACATLAARILQRGPVAVSERAPHGQPITPTQIAIGTAHRDQARAIRSALGPRFAEITVDTASRLQGREFEVTIVLHPLAGRRDATAFHLEAGRPCVLTSRHRHACIVVARAGIPELLDAHPSTEPVHLNVLAKFPDGWEANQAVLARLSHHRVRAL